MKIGDIIVNKKKNKEAMVVTIGRVTEQVYIGDEWLDDYDLQDWSIKKKQD